MYIQTYTYIITLSLDFILDISTCRTPNILVAAVRNISSR